MERKIKILFIMNCIGPPFLKTLLSQAYECTHILYKGCIAQDIDEKIYTNNMKYTS